MFHSIVLRLLTAFWLLAAVALEPHRVGAQEVAVPLDAATRVLHATLKVVHPRSTATGLLVELPEGISAEPRTCALVTANHVFEQTVGESTTLVLRKLVPDGTYARQDLSVQIRDKETARWTKHPKLDVAVLKVEIPADVATTPIPHASLADEPALKTTGLRVGSRLLTMGYPVRFEANGAGFPVVRQGVIASFPLIPVARHPLFLIDMTAFPGDSGGPVFTAPREASVETPDPPLVVGLITGQVRNDEKTQTLMEERVVHHSLGLAVVVQAQYIRETIELLRAPKE